MKLTTRQLEVLSKMDEEGRGSAYGLRTSLNVLEALSVKGLVSPVGVGHMAFPRNATWQITDAGRAAIHRL